MASSIKNAVNNLVEKVTSPKSSAPPQKEPEESELKELRDKYEKAGQDHVFKFYDELDVGGKASLFEQLSNFDPAYINDITHRALNPPAENNDAKLEPLPDSATASILDSKQEDLDRWYKQGLELVSLNTVAVVLMAGGQGTRLGSSAPKGCFDIGLPSHKSLFQLQAERIAKIQSLAAKAHSKADGEVVVPWYVMTSGPTRGPTSEYFEKHAYFGLKKEHVLIFEQGVLPCISNEGKILLETKSKVSVAPDGNGGIYKALLTSGIREDMQRRGIKHIHAYCVDNCLARVADPVFIGFSAEKDVDIGTKVVRKRDAKESVGLILLKNGKPDVVEYSELDEATASAEVSDSEHPGQTLLKFRAANIVNHYYSSRFLEGIEIWASQLPHHVARKKIPYLDLESGQSVKPEKPNGIKLELFVFDTFPLLPLNKFASLEVQRQDEFSPLKNAKGTGADDPDTSRADILAQGARWVRAAGATLESEEASAEVEIGPLISYGGEGLEYLKAKSIKAPAVLEVEKQ